VTAFGLVERVTPFKKVEKRCANSRLMPRYDLWNEVRSRTLSDRAGWLPAHCTTVKAPTASALSGLGPFVSSVRKPPLDSGRRPDFEFHRKPPLTSAECRQIVQRKRLEAAGDRRYGNELRATAEAWRVLAAKLEQSEAIEARFFLR
jgi:hypothetical protein